MTIEMDISPKTAMQYALEDAKKKALVEVCGEKMNAWDMVESSSAGESFNSLNMIQIDGEIVDYDVLEQNHMVNPVRKSEIIYYCIINAHIKKGIEPDPDFVASIKGIKASYQAEEELTFSVIAYRDAYVKVFIFENEELGYRLYPNELEQPFKLNANQEYLFPTNKRSSYPVYTDKDIETDRIVFVFTKNERPFYEETTSRKEIESWMAKIPNNQRFVYYTSINILKK